MGKIMLEVNDLKTKYITRFHEDVYAVDGVSLKIEEGKSLGIAGESGCGKSFVCKERRRRGKETCILRQESRFLHRGIIDIIPKQAKTPPNRSEGFLFSF